MAEPLFCLRGFDPHWATCMTKTEWAAWVQAVGSIIGIAVAIWVVRHQLARTRRTMREALAERLRARGILMAELAQRVDSAVKAKSESDVGHAEYLAHEEVAMHCLRALLEIPLETATEPLELRLLLEAKPHLRHLRQLLETCRATTTPDGATAQAVREHTLWLFRSAQALGRGSLEATYN